MKRWYLVPFLVPLLGAGCMASTAVDVNDSGVDVDGGIDLNASGSVDTSAEGREVNR